MPPIGTRSLGGTLHALNFDAPAGDYFKRANDEILVVLQTESPEGVANAEAIYSLPGVDAIFVGRADPDGLRTVVSVHPGLKAWTGIVPLVRGAHGVLELPVGTIAASGTMPGDMIQLE